MGAEVQKRLEQGAAKLWLSVYETVVEGRWDLGISVFGDARKDQALRRKRFVEYNSMYRDIMERGSRDADALARCIHCYDVRCAGCKRKRYARYSEADYSPYESGEADLIACIDILCAQRI